MLEQKLARIERWLVHRSTCTRKLFITVRHAFYRYHVCDQLPLDEHAGSSAGTFQG